MQSVYEFFKVDRVEMTFQGETVLLTLSFQSSKYHFTIRYQDANDFLLGNVINDNDSFKEPIFLATNKGLIIRKVSSARISRKTCFQLNEDMVAFIQDSIGSEIA